MKLVNVMAASLDGCINEGKGEGERERRQSGFVTEDDRVHVESLLKTADAVIVGSRSVRAAGRLWLLAGARSHPLWVIYTNRGFPADHAVWTQGAEVWLVSRDPLPPEGQPPAGAVGTFRQLSYKDTREPGRFVREKLAERGCQTVLLFGGGELNQIFYREGLVDELRLTLCPLIVANPQASRLVAPGLNRPVHMSHVASHAKGNLVFLTYTVQYPE